MKNLNRILGVLALLALLLLPAINASASVNKSAPIVVCHDAAMDAAVNYAFSQGWISYGSWYNYFTYGTYPPELGNGGGGGNKQR